MTVAVCCVLSDGIVLGVDSAITIGNFNNPSKVYEGAEKIFQLANLPIGVATYGAAAFGSRSIGNILREFEVVNPSGVISPNASMAAVVEEMRAFFMQRYNTLVVPELEARLGVPFAQVPDDQKPAVGLIVAGYSGGAYLPEAWNVLIPANAAANSAALFSVAGQVGLNWFATYGPIQRYLKGIDPQIFDALIGGINQIREPLTNQEIESLVNMLATFEYPIVLVGMPIALGVSFVRFLVDLVINHFRFATGAAIVGGRARIGVVTYNSEAFKIE